MRVYRASALGGCMKAQVAEQLGMVALSTEKQMEDLGREGQLHEMEVIDRLRKSGAIVVDEQKEVDLEILPEVIVRGHIDAKSLKLEKFWRVLEVKSMGAAPYKAWMKTRWDTPGLVQKYKWQVSVYMLATTYPLLFAVKNRNTGKLDLSTVEEPFYTREQILARVLEMERYVRMGELPDTCDLMFPCPYYYLHDQTSMEVTEDDAIEKLAIAYDEARSQNKLAENRRDEVRKALDIGLAGRDRVDTATVTVAYNSTSRVQPRYDLMKEDGVYEKYVEVVEGKQLQVTVKEKDVDG